MFAPGLCPLPHVASSVRVVDGHDRTDAAERLRNDEVLLTREARAIAALSATVAELKSALAASMAVDSAQMSHDTMVRPIAHDPATSEAPRIAPTERLSLSQRPEITVNVLPTVYSNNGSLIDVFA